MQLLTAKPYAKDLQPGELSLFPTETMNGPSFSQEELLKLSGLFAPLYQSYVDNLSRSYSSHFRMPVRVCEIVVRESIVPLVHFFLDRLLRMDLHLKEYGSYDMAVMDPGPVDVPMNIETFKLYSWSSFEFNQSVLCRLAEVFGLSTVSNTDRCQTRCDDLCSIKSSNHNYDQNISVKIRRVAYLGFLRLLSHIFPSTKGNIPVLGMSYATPFLQAKGLYGFSSLEFVGGGIHFDEVSPDMEDRKSVFDKALSGSSSALHDFFDSVNLDMHFRKKAEEVLNGFILEYYPSTLLECFRDNVQKCVKRLERYGSRSMIFSNSGALESICFLAAARLRGMKIIEFQEGGHEGYEDDYVQALDAEYNYLDGFISWGWDRLPYERLGNKIDVVPLPSPWLCERKRMWKNNSKNGRKDFDLLFMPNKVWPYPPAPSGANVSRIDHIQKFVSILKELIEKSAGRGLRVLHKPFNQTTMSLLHDTMLELEALGGSNYVCDHDLSKGLRKELVERSKVVIWDQPGTGFLECLTSEIPTMILWPRMYNREVDEARALFLELEKVGVCHRTVDSLLDEYKKFSESQDRWMKNGSRVAVVDRFCRKYAWTERSWPQYWREYISSLNRN